MKKLTILTLTLVLTALVQLTAPPVQAEVSIPDANLAAVIREALELPPGAAITSDALRNLTRLQAEGRGIADLTGLEHAVNLVELVLSGTAVSDVSALANLTNLEKLDLEGTNVSDVSALAILTNLRMLYLEGTAVLDISALAELTNLRVLYLEGTAVSDVSALAHLTNLESLSLESTNVSDVSALAILTNLKWLYLEGTAVLDISALAELTNLKSLDLRGCWLNAAAHQTHIPAIQLNGTQVEFDPFKPIPLPGVPSLVSLIYFRPSDSPVRPNVDAEIDALIREAQRFFADEMERHGFGRKTFQFEADANGNAVVHHVNGKFTEAHYRQNGGWITETREQISMPHQSITVYMLDGDILARSNGGGSPYRGGSANIRRWRGQWDWSTIAHELGHAFGMMYHDHRARSLMSYRGFGGLLSPCFAEWLDVHPAFNPAVVRSGTRATVEMLPATLAAPPNAIRLRFTVTAPAGSLYQARLWIFEKELFIGIPLTIGGLLGCKRIDGNPTSSTVEFVTALTPDTEWVNLHIIGIDGDSVGDKRVPIDVASLLPPAKVVSIPDPNLAAAVRETLKMSSGETFTTHSILNLVKLDERGRGIADLTGLEYAVNLIELELFANPISNLSPLASLTNLQMLYLEGTDVSDVSALARLTNLRSLYLHNTDVSNVSALAHLTNLRWLWLVGCPLSYASIHTHIPALQAKGIEVAFDNVAHPALLKVSGDGQEGTGATALPNPFVVEAMDEHGKPIVGRTVQFDILGGGGTLSAKTVETDAQGKARVTLTLGSSQGVNKVKAFSEGIQSWVLFTAVATEDAPPLVGDVNGDGVTDMADLAIVSQLVAQTMGKPVENPHADVNGDGVVDGEDFALVAAHLGEGEAAAPSQAALPAGLTLEKVEWALNFLYAENTGSPVFQRGIAKLEGFLALLVPDKTLLLANYPNPFNPETWIPYQLSEPAEVTVTIYAVNGAVVRMLDIGHRRAGSYDSRHRAAYWDGRNAAGESVASGVYFYTLSAGDFSATRKMVIRK